MIKLIALDLDNTLLEKDLNIAEKTLKLLQQCADKGVEIVIATGRLFYSAEKYARQIGPKTKVLCYNGCLVTEADGTTLFKAELSTEIMRKVAKFAKERGLYSQFYKDHKILVEKITDGTTIDPDLANTTAIEVGDFNTYEFTPSPKAMIVAKPEDVPMYQAQLKAELDNHTYIAQSQPYLIEIMPDDINKAHSLEILCDKLGINKEEVMACGDNTNDAEMVIWAGLGVAMANAVDSLKEVAEYVCENERSYGVAEAIEKFVLI